MKSLCQLVLGISKVYVIFKKYILYPGYTLFQNAESRSKAHIQNQDCKLIGINATYAEVDSQSVI